MSVRRPAAARRPVTRSLAAVLAAGQQREEATSGLFGKTDYKEKFRAALMKNKMDKAEAAAAKLTTAQIKQLEKEFKKYEEAGWKDQADNTALEAMEGPNRDSWKGQMERVEAQQKILRAHYGLGALHIFTKGGAYTVAMPMKPENMGYVYHALSRWPNADFRRGTHDAWASLRNIGDYLEKSNDVVRQKERQRG